MSQALKKPRQRLCPSEMEVALLKTRIRITPTRSPATSLTKTHPSRRTRTTCQTIRMIAATATTPTPTPTTNPATPRLNLNLKASPPKTTMTASKGAAAQIQKTLLPHTPLLISNSTTSPHPQKTFTTLLHYP
ncbi:hypothetical protein H2248_005186 [Termitomyces sp. 'cryptogamus']|nr:hypothetical protein H2248_005186 [Termitomyces sp. 'cryptogamus']